MFLSHFIASSFRRASHKYIQLFELCLVVLSPVFRTRLIPSRLNARRVTSEHRNLIVSHKVQLFCIDGDGVLCLFFLFFSLLPISLRACVSVRFTASSSLSPLLLSTSPTFPSHSLPKYIVTVQLTNSYFFFSFLSFLLVSQRRQRKEEARERATVPPKKLEDLFTHVSSSPLHTRPFARDPPPWVDRMPCCP